MIIAPKATTIGAQAPIEVGTHKARISQIIDLGMQEQRPYMGVAKPAAPEIMVTYELLDEFVKDSAGNPTKYHRIISERFRLCPITSDLARSTQRYKAIMGANGDGDFSKLIDVPCYVNVTHSKNVNTDKTYVNVASISKMRASEAETAPALNQQAIVLALAEKTPANWETYKALPAWIKSIIQKGLDYTGSWMESADKGDDFVEMDAPAVAGPAMPWDK